MALVVNTNTASLNVQYQLKATQYKIGESYQRLSSGLRINSAKDDAAGLAISDRIESILRGQTVAVRNANDAISFSQVAEAGLAGLTSLLQRMRELAVQSANAGLSDDDHAALNTEFVQLQHEVTRITATTKFNDLVVLDGSEKTFQIGYGTAADNRLSFVGHNLITDTSFTGLAAFVNNGVTQATMNKAKSDFMANGGTFNTSDGSPAAGSGLGNLNSTQTAFQNNISAADQTTFNTAKNAFISAGGRFSAVDGSAIAAKSGTALIGGVNTPVSTANDLNALNAFNTAQLDFYAAAKGIQILDQTSSLSAMVSIDNALAEISTEAALFGSTQNRLAGIISGLQSSIENQAAAKSRIVDTDFAAETAALAKHQILQKASTAVLAQANQMTSNVMALLK